MKIQMALLKMTYLCRCSLEGHKTTGTPCDLPPRLRKDEGRFSRRVTLVAGGAVWTGIRRREAWGEEGELCGPSLGYMCTDVATDPALVRVTTEDYSFYIPKDYTRGSEDTASEIFTSMRFQSRDGAESLSLVRRLASSIKPTFFQVSDISKYGDVKEVAQLVLPRGPKELLSARSRIIRQDPIDTGTIRGVVTVPDVTIYSYQLRTGKGFVVWISAAASRGNVFLLATSTTQERFKEVESTFQTVHDSFQLFRKVDA